MSPNSQARDSETLGSQATTQEKAGADEAENISTTMTGKLQKISPNSSHKIEAVVSAENDTITVATESSISPATVVALGGEDAAAEFVESFAASFAEKYSAEFQNKLIEMKEMKAMILKEDGMADVMNENADGKERIEEISTATKHPVSPPALAELIPGETVEQTAQEPLMESEPTTVEKPPVAIEGKKRQNSHRVRRRRRRGSGSSSNTTRSVRSVSQSSISSGSVSRRPDDVTSEYDAKEVTIEDMKVQVWKIDDVSDSSKFIVGYVLLENS